MPPPSLHRCIYNSIHAVFSGVLQPICMAIKEELFNHPVLCLSSPVMEKVLFCISSLRVALLSFIFCIENVSCISIQKTLTVLI